MKNATNQKNKDWSIEIEDFTGIDIELLSKILLDGEKYFDGLADDNNSLTNKVFTILSILISVIGILISFLITKISIMITTNQKVILFAVLILAIVCSYCIYLLIKIIFPKRMNVKGEQPKPIDFLTLETIDQEIQYRSFIFDSIEAVQNKIDFNEVLIQYRLRIFQKVLKLSNITFLVVMLIITVLLLTS